MAALLPGDELMPATKRGNAITVASALRNPLTDPNMADEWGVPAIVYAAAFGHDPVMLLLLADERVNPNMADRNGTTALHWAVHNDNAPVVKLLLGDERVDLNIENRVGNTAVMISVRNGRAALLELLLADHRTIRRRLSYGGDFYDAALFNVKYPRRARLKGLVRAVVVFRRMRLRAAEVVYAPRGAGFATAAASFNAAVAARRRLPSTLFENGESHGEGSPVTSSLPCSGSSPPSASPEELLPAAERGDAATVASALRNPLTDPNIINQLGDTTLMIACCRGHASVVRVLLADERFNLNTTNHFGLTGLMLAALEGHASVVELLLGERERVNPNVATRVGFTALLIAVTKTHAPVVKLLLADERVDPNMISTFNGFTALMYAAYHQDVSVLELLLTDHRTIRTRPTGIGLGGRTYDAALFNVKYARRIRFRGLVRAVVALRRLRLRAAEAAYAPGGTGFAAAAASFNAAIATSQDQQ